MSSSGLTRGSLFCNKIPRSSRGITQDLWNSKFILRNSRILVIASEAKQSLGILDLFLGILNLFLGILEFCSL